MTPFQWIVLPFIALLAGRNLYLAIKSKGRRKHHVWGGIVWLAAGACVFRPEALTSAASLIGIGRGADLVLYGLCIVFLAVALYAYTRFQQLDVALTEVVRHLALKNATGGPLAGGDRDETVVAPVRWTNS